MIAVFITGCLINENASVCCESIANNTCTKLNNSYQIIDGGTCNSYQKICEGVKVKIGNNEMVLTIPYCSDANYSLCGEGCSIIEIKKYKEERQANADGWQRFTILNNSEFIGPTPSASGDINDVIGLLYAHTELYTISKDKVPSLTSRLYPFKFGVGTSFEEFNIAKHFFPTSDDTCCFVPFAPVYRYSFYILPEKPYSCQPTDQGIVCKKDGKQLGYFKDYAMCLMNCNDEYLGHNPPRLFTPYTFCRGNEDIPLNIKLAYEIYLRGGAPERDYMSPEAYFMFYLPLEYSSRDEFKSDSIYGNKFLESGTSTPYGTKIGFPFECRESRDCKSGLCSFYSYRHYVCPTKFSSAVDCGCAITDGSTVYSETSPRQCFQEKDFYVATTSAGTYMFKWGNEESDWIPTLETNWRSLRRDILLLRLRLPEASQGDKRIVEKITAKSFSRSRRLNIKPLDNDFTRVIYVDMPLTQSLEKTVKDIKRTTPFLRKCLLTSYDSDNTVDDEAYICLNPVIGEMAKCYDFNSHSWKCTPEYLFDLDENKDDFEETAEILETLKPPTDTNVVKVFAPPCCKDEVEERAREVCDREFNLKDPIIKFIFGLEETEESNALQKAKTVTVPPLVLITYKSDAKWQGTGIEYDFWFGRCLVDSPKILGWCEPCTSLSFASQNLTSLGKIKGYWPNGQGAFTTKGVIMPYKASYIEIKDDKDELCDAGGHKAVAANIVLLPRNTFLGCSEQPKGSNDYDFYPYDNKATWLHLPEFDPDYLYMVKNIKKQLVSGITPILFMEDENLYKYKAFDVNWVHDDKDMVGSVFVTKVLRDIFSFPEHVGTPVSAPIGPVITVVGTYPDVSINDLIERASIIKENKFYDEKHPDEVLKGSGFETGCPTCDVAVAFEGDMVYSGEKYGVLLKGTANSLFGLPGNSHHCKRADIRFSGKLHNPILNIDTEPYDCNEEAMRYFDIIVEKIDINPGSNWPSEKEEAEKRYEAMVDSMIRLAKLNAYYTGKPTLFYITSIKKEKGFDVKEFFNAMAMKTSEMAESGILGVHIAKFVDEKRNVNEYLGFELDKSGNLPEINEVDKDYICGIAQFANAYAGLSLTNRMPKRINVGNCETKLPDCLNIEQCIFKGQPAKLLCINEKGEFIIYSSNPKQGEKDINKIFNNFDMYSSIISSLTEYSYKTLCNKDENGTYSYVPINFPPAAGIPVAYDSTLNHSCLGHSLTFFQVADLFGISQMPVACIMLSG